MKFLATIAGCAWAGAILAALVVLAYNSSSGGVLSGGNVIDQDRVFEVVLGWGGGAGAIFGLLVAVAIAADGPTSKPPPS